MDFLLEYLFEIYLRFECRTRCVDARRKVCAYLCMDVAKLCSNVPAKGCVRGL